jgi:hypothetical protein
MSATEESKDMTDSFKNVIREEAAYRINSQK